MGKLQEFEITFDTNKVLYSPGEYISGTLKIILAQALQCKVIKVNCNGFCGVTNKVNDTSWTVEEQYFNSTVSVADKGTLKAGDHIFPFKFLIPATAPTSFEGNYGKIVYRVRAFVDTPRFIKDYKMEKPFYLLRLLDLNEVPNILEPSSSAVTRQFTYLLVKSGTVLLEAASDMRGYTPGQVIQLTTSIHNQSGRRTGTVVASLMQRVTYETKRPTHDERTIAEVEGSGVKAGKQAVWKEQMIVPALPQSSLTGCDLIKMEYYIKVSIKSPEVLLTLPIHIGNISLDKNARPPPRPTPSTTDLEPPAPATPTLPSAPATPTLPPCTAPKPAPRSRASYHASSPSAPPAEEHRGAAGGTGATKSHAQLSASGPHPHASAAANPHRFSYAPGLTFSESGATMPTMPTACPLILPPDYSNSAYPQEAPPSYNQSCNT